MVDQETKDVSAGPTGAPVNRDARREPEVIEAKSLRARRTAASRRRTRPRRKAALNLARPSQPLRALAFVVFSPARSVG